jgi:hypothetical protein
MTNITYQIITRHYSPIIKRLVDFQGHRGGRFAYLDYFRTRIGFVQRMRQSVTGSLEHSEFQDIQGRLGLK